MFSWTFSNKNVDLRMLFIPTIDINECASSPCSGDATCSNTDGSFQCTCKIGFSGDGTTCTGIKIL